jgi:hypothetical protein
MVASYFTVATRPSRAPWTKRYRDKTRHPWLSEPASQRGWHFRIDRKPAFSLHIFDRVFFTAKIKIHNAYTMNVYLNFLHSSRERVVLRATSHSDAGPTLTDIYFRIIVFNRYET